MGVLRSNVFVGNEWYGPAYGNADQVPDELVDGLAAGVWEEAPATAAVPEPEQSTVEAGGEPPRSGKGSGRDAWAEYALAQGVDVPDDATRDDIIAAVGSQQ